MDTLPIKVSETGEVFFEGKKCSTQRDSRGYGSVRISLHRLVAYAFHGNPPSAKHVCHHKDGNPRNNSASNLQWVTQAENMRLRFIDRPRKLTNKQVTEILSKKPAPVETLADLAVSFGVSYSAVKAVRSGHSWNKGWAKHNRAILTKQQVDKIKNWQKPVITAAVLARKFNVSDATILNIWHGRF